MNSGRKFWTVYFSLMLFGDGIVFGLLAAKEQLDGWTMALIVGAGVIIISALILVGEEEEEPLSSPPLEEGKK